MSYLLKKEIDIRKKKLDCLNPVIHTALLCKVSFHDIKTIR
jgi:hypothetical protein